LHDEFSAVHHRSLDNGESVTITVVARQLVNYPHVIVQALYFGPKVRNYHRAVHPAFGATGQLRAQEVDPHTGKRHRNGGIMERTPVFIMRQIRAWPI
jgi:hypothetical protein